MNVVWLWQSDSGEWSKYDATTAATLEYAHSNGEKTGRVDDERFLVTINYLAILIISPKIRGFRKHVAEAFR